MTRNVKKLKSLGVLGQCPGRRTSMFGYWGKVEVGETPLTHSFGFDFGVVCFVNI
jgi:hypothetical protein